MSFLHKRNMIYTDKWTKGTVNMGSFSICLKKGDMVKLKNPYCESFWVCVEYRHEKDSYVGKVDSHLIRPSSYSYGDHVLFSLEDVHQYKSVEKQLELYNDFSHQLGLLFKKYEDNLDRRLTSEEMDYLFAQITSS